MRYKLFGEHTGLRVSEVVLGAGMFGLGRGYGTDPDESRRIIDAYADAGGNFIDTANFYQGRQSEEIVGDVLKGRRDDFVVATKYTAPGGSKGGILTTGNSRKAMIVSIEDSLKRLKMDYVDLLWVHMSDGVTPAEEIVRGFDDLVRAGKVIYAGLSDYPAWRIARAATIAELRGAAPIAGIQFEHSLVERSSEQELIPAGKALGLGMVAWSPLGGGLLTGKYRKGEAGRKQGWGGNVFQQENSLQRTKIVDTVIEVADELGVSPGEVAIAWVNTKGAFPIIGPRTLDQLHGNLAALKLELSADHIDRLETASALPATFPYTVLESARAIYTGGNTDAFSHPADSVA
ncbi:aldo/keto reductase [Xanthomonas campestris pv. raphani]|uniref:aldo/keto reductase n=3 Tax=Xanthomonas campestris TaxID=339 RepID=UPI001F3B3EC9|nr:aldo/keto reductase [Xanthomonas campestris]MCF8826449.1 aldo/keto reductase [Xanthomonas campestris pv. raphani]